MIKIKGNTVKFNKSRVKRRVFTSKGLEKIVKYIPTNIVYNLDFTFSRLELLKQHLNNGLKNGALTQEQADSKLATWFREKSISPLKNTNLNNNIFNGENLKDDNILEKEYEIVSNFPFSKTVKMSGTIKSVTKYNPTIIID